MPVGWHDGGSVRCDHIRNPDHDQLYIISLPIWLSQKIPTDGNFSRVTTSNRFLSSFYYLYFINYLEAHIQSYKTIFSGCKFVLILLIKNYILRKTEVI